MLLNNARICLNMTETEPKITVQDKWHLQTHRRISNFEKHQKWSNKERSAEMIIAWNYFPKTLEYVRLRSKYRRAFEYSRVLNMP